MGKRHARTEAQLDMFAAQTAELVAPLLAHSVDDGLALPNDCVEVEQTVVIREPTTFPADDTTTGWPIWLCFFSGPDGIPKHEPGIVRAGSRQQAEADAAIVCNTTTHDVLAIRASEAMVASNKWLPERKDGAFTDRLMASLALMSRNSEAENDELRRIHAELLGCSVDEVDARIADKTTAKRAKMVPRKVADVPQVEPSSHSGKSAQGMRRLTQRQRDLLALVRVDGQRAFVDVDGHVPDWSDLKDTMQLLGAKWKTSTKKVPGHFVFPDDVDAADMVGVALDAGEVFDARLHGAFFTPERLADELVAMTPLIAMPDQRLRVLEPSAGSGRLADAVKRAYPNADVDCIELLAEHRELLKAAGHSVIEGIDGDFMLVHPSCEGFGEYDAAIMNPPFQRGIDRVHVLHAVKFVRIGGVVSAIMSGSIVSTNDARSERLRHIVATHGGRIVPIDAGAFAESGTMVRTAMLTFNVCAHCRNVCSVVA